jgi:hypothetical protein
MQSLLQQPESSPDRCCPCVLDLHRLLAPPVPFALHGVDYFQRQHVLRVSDSDAFITRLAASLTSTAGCGGQCALPSLDFVAWQDNEAVSQPPSLLGNPWLGAEASYPVSHVAPTCNDALGSALLAMSTLCCLLIGRPLLSDTPLTALDAVASSRKLPLAPAVVGVRGVGALAAGSAFKPSPHHLPSNVLAVMGLVTSHADLPFPQLCGVPGVAQTLLDVVGRYLRVDEPSGAVPAISVENPVGVAPH